MGTGPSLSWVRGRLQSSGSEASAIQHRALREEPERYLSRFGYGACDDKPELRITVENHQEEEGHTMYNIRCTIRCEAIPSMRARYDWTCKKRLCDLREFLLDPVKSDLGQDYAP